MGRVYNGKCACCGKWSSNPVGPFKGCPLGKKIPVPCYVPLPNYRAIRHNRLCGKCFLYHTLNAPVEEKRRYGYFSHTPSRRLASYYWEESPERFDQKDRKSVV